ncbi:MAG TPA: imidazole glycerol phosphate synthase subunit HisH [Solirubrobacteraceae bacterium]|nr:imidazole glycerol phosphate synthase subunit HisH [Solirubrobacteraceae bacterium]
MSPAPPMVAVVDYGMGNRRSVQKALEHLGARVQVTRDPARLAAADGVVLPGVGAFAAAMSALSALDLIDPIRAAAANERPLLGICLGMQLLFERSSELGETAGLGLLAGEVTRLEPGPGLRIPHIGWNEVRAVRPAAILDGMPARGAAFYHVHSYAVRPSDPADVAATTTYGETFATVVARGTVMGTQFHPEKSSVRGLRLLEAFCMIAAGASRPTRTAG